jgi:hypothetical protein
MFALGAFFAREMGVTVRLGRILRPCGEEEFLEVKIRFRRSVHFWLFANPVVLLVHCTTT